MTLTFAINTGKIQKQQQDNEKMKSLIYKMKICAWSGVLLLVVVVKRSTQRLVSNMKKKKREWEVDDYQPRYANFYSKVGLVITLDIHHAVWNVNKHFEILT